MRPPLKIAVLSFFILLNTLLHLPFLSLPPCGDHVWRQCNTMAMSRNMHEGDGSLMAPSIDRRNATNGITGSHFPLYEWGLAQWSKLTGFNDQSARTYALVIFSVAMLLMYSILLFLGIDWIQSVLGALLLLTIPQFYYDSINAMPDNLALCMALLAWRAQLAMTEQKTSFLWVLLASLSALLCGLIKPQFLIIPMSNWWLIANKRSIGFFLYPALFVLLGVGVWYWHAEQLTQVNNLKEFGLWIKPIGFAAILKTVFKNIVSDWPELLLGWPLFVAFILLAFGVKHKPYYLKQTIKWQMLGFVLFYALAIERMHDHSYYFMAILPIMVLLVVTLLQNTNKSLLYLSILCLLNGIWAYYRIVPNRWQVPHLDIPMAFADRAQRDTLTQYLNHSEHCLVGPDVSGCVWFYFTHTKGFSFEHAEELFENNGNGTWKRDMSAFGIDYLLIDTSAHTKRYLLDHIPNKRLLKTVSGLSVWKIEHP